MANQTVCLQAITMHKRWKIELHGHRDSDMGTSIISEKDALYHHLDQNPTSVLHFTAQSYIISDYVTLYKKAFTV